MNSVLEHANRDENHLGMVSCLGSARVEIAACSVGGRARGRGFLGKSLAIQDRTSTDNQRER